MVPHAAPGSVIPEPAMAATPSQYLPAPIAAVVAAFRRARLKARNATASSTAGPTTAADNGALAPDIADEALGAFARSHVGILQRMAQLRELPQQLAREGLAGEVRETAARIHRHFNQSVLPHHDEEEVELFPALLHSAQAGDEAGLVKSLVHRLEAEHRTLEEMWDRLEPALRRIGRGRRAELDAALVERFTRAYVEHAQFEEATVLPMAGKILKSGDRSALALALAMRRRPARSWGYI
jgi:hemerythrin-like domain-containing protein